jgi:hypothetical protein
MATCESLYRRGVVANARRLAATELNAADRRDAYDAEVAACSFAPRTNAQPHGVDYDYSDDDDPAPRLDRLMQPAPPTAPLDEGGRALPVAKGHRQAAFVEAQLLAATDALQRDGDRAAAEQQRYERQVRQSHSARGDSSQAVDRLVRDGQRRRQRADEEAARVAAAEEERAAKMRHRSAVARNHGEVSRRLMQPPRRGTDVAPGSQCTFRPAERKASPTMLLCAAPAVRATPVTARSPTARNSMADRAVQRQRDRRQKADEAAAAAAAVEKRRKAALKRPLTAVLNPATGGLSSRGLVTRRASWSPRSMSPPPPLSLPTERPLSLEELRAPW